MSIVSVNELATGSWEAIVSTQAELSPSNESTLCSDDLPKTVAEALGTVTVADAVRPGVFAGRLSPGTLMTAVFVRLVPGAITLFAGRCAW
jgi:hypothetical protein